MTIIEGHILDPDGHPVPQAAVYFVSSPTSRQDIGQLSDEKGVFKMTAPVPGRYIIGVRSDTWGSLQKELEVKDESSIFVEFQLGVEGGEP